MPPFDLGRLRSGLCDDAVLAYPFDAARFADLRTPESPLSGQDSPDVLHPATALVHAALPDSRIAVLPGQQHIAYRTAPELFAETVLVFLGR